MSGSKGYVLVLVGSRRKRNTWTLADSLRPAIEAAGYELLVESIFDYTVQLCIGCHRCVEGHACALHDGSAALMAKLEAAAGVILASPVYMCGVSGALKVFIDRTAAWFHRPVLVGKPAMVLVTTAGSYQKETIAYLATICMHWGLLYTGGVSRDVGSLGKPLAQEEFTAFIKVLQAGKAVFKPSLRQLALYQVQKVLALKILPYDALYWKGKGWDQRHFYVDCSIPLWKAAVAKLFYRLLFARIKGFDADA
ncbi:MAG: flavodoxin family protein [Spirochaetes bacterium]|nr:flavodoxin family protein [Spirochaetota bacterium]MBU0955365.1 flavodoxin family protein [Spirochaetota bacterium]